MKLYYCKRGVDYTGIYITVLAETKEQAVKVAFAQYSVEEQYPVISDNMYNTRLEYYYEIDPEEFRIWLRNNLVEYSEPVAFVIIRES